ncbi:MAG: hypothetical protein JSV64_01605 [Candidatus Bathyarchaeota archaeon]|nr:MAG: hypothetical protein JSV64_01605 [Candidatus Bathyarchaeota archaeon]
MTAEDGVDKVDEYFRGQREVFTSESYEELRDVILRECGFFDKLKDPEYRRKIIEGKEA